MHDAHLMCAEQWPKQSKTKWHEKKIAMRSCCRFCLKLYLITQFDWNAADILFSILLLLVVSGMGMLCIQFEPNKFSMIGNL